MLGAEHWVLQTPLFSAPLPLLRRTGAKSPALQMEENGAQNTDETDAKDVLGCFSAALATLPLGKTCCPWTRGTVPRSTRGPRQQWAQMS